MLRRALGNIPISYIFLSIPLHSRGATRDRHLSRGGVRWTRQRRRGGRGARGPQGLASGPMEPTTLRVGRRHFAVRAGAEMRPAFIAVARRPESCGPGARCWRKGTERLHADRPQETRSGRSRPHCLVPSVTNASVSIAAGESTKQAGSLTACGMPDVSVRSW